MSVIVWGALGVAAMLVPESQLVVSVLATAFGAWVFWTHGGHQITGAGLYSLSSAIFAGFAGIYHSIQYRPVDVFLPIAIAFWTHFGMWLFWQRSEGFPVIRAASPEVTGWGIWGGLALGGVGLVLQLADIGVSAHLILGGLGLLLVSLVLHRARGDNLTGRLVLAGLVVIVYWQTSFGGYGRLYLVALGLVALVLTSARTDARRVKALTLLALGPVLWLFVRLREQLGLERVGTEFDGLGSVVNPLRTFGDLIALGQVDRLPWGYGDTFLATLLFWVPRAMWPSKPAGFGSELTVLLKPDLARFGHSMAAHSTGEWFYNFGWFGLVAMVPLLGLGLRWLDNGLREAASSPLLGRRNLLYLFAVVMLVANAPSLIWVGSFTFVARGVQQVAFPGLILWPFASGRKDAGAARPTAKGSRPSLPRTERVRRTQGLR